MTQRRAFYLCLILDALFEGGRLFAGATSAAFLISRGISLSEVALLKSVQAIVILTCDVPTGIFADIKGRKSSLTLSLISSLAGFAIYFYAQGFMAYVVGEGLVALSLCFWSGAYEAFAIEYASLDSTPGLLDRYFHLNQAVNSGAVLICGFLGGLLGARNLVTPYLGAVCAMILAFVILTRCKITESSSTISPQTPDLWYRTKNAFRQGFFNKKLRPFFIANIAIQFVIQPILHYWQPYFQGFSPHVTSETLGTVFSLYCATNLVCGAMATRLSKRKYFRSNIFTALLFTIFGILFASLGLITSFTVAVLAFCLMQGVLSVARTALSIRFNEQLTGLPRASVLSSLSLISRLGMVGSLGVLSIMTQSSKMQQESQIYILFGGFSIIASATAIVGILQRKGHAHEYQTTAS